MKNFFPLSLALFALLTLPSCSGKKPIQGAATPDSNPAALPAKGLKEVSDCSVTKEYVTTLEYLRSNKALAMQEPKMREVAEKVSSECSGAAERFIRVTTVLTHAGLGSKNAIDIGFEFIKESQLVANAFVEIFKYSFSSDGLDVDINTSIQLARSLSTEFNGDHEVALKDFHRLVKFCVSDRDLDLPRPECGAFAARIARLSFDPLKIHRSGVTNHFLDAYDFLRSEKGINLARPAALRTAEELLSISPAATENFIQAYRYATSTKGLGLGAQEAFTFAKELAHKTRPKNKTVGSKSNVEG